MKPLPSEDAYKLITEQGHRFFKVTFIKKTTGELREMVCRRHVAKGVKGVLPPGERKAADLKANVITVWDAGVRDFRRINLDQVLEVVASGETYTSE